MIHEGRWVRVGGYREAAYLFGTGPGFVPGWYLFSSAAGVRRALREALAGPFDTLDDARKGAETDDAR